MNENSKTLSFLGVAVLAVVIAFVTRPTAFTADPKEDLGGALFPDYKEPLSAASLEIVDYDDKTGEAKPFKVVRTNDVWSIPSHSNYPADAQQQLGVAAAALLDLKKLSLVSDNRSDQETYGVIDPTSKDVTAASKGVGKLVKLSDSSGKALVDLVIGHTDTAKKSDGPEDPGKGKIFFVRRPDQDRIYRTELNIDKLSTNFSDWIEKDLLKMNALDFKSLVIDDYSLTVVAQLMNNRLVKMASPDPRDKCVLTFDGHESKWAPQDLKHFDRKKKAWEDLPLTADQELDQQKLNDLKSALDDLKIIDVARKPAGLGADLMQGVERVAGDEAFDSLEEHGFVPVQIGDKIELRSTDGEVHAGMKDGVEYVLRFGKIAGRDSKDPENKDEAKKDDEKKTDKPEDAKKTEDEKKADENDDSVSRYLLVMARFNQDLIAKPELQPLPSETPVEPEKKPEPAGDDKPAAADKPATDPNAKPAADAPAKEAKPAEPAASPADAPKPEGDKKPAADTPAEKKPAEKTSQVNNIGDTELALADEPAKPATDTKPAADVKAAEAAKPAEATKPADPAKPVEAAKPADAPKATEPATPADPKAAEPAKPAADPFKSPQPAAGPAAPTPPAATAAPAATAKPKTEAELARARIEKDNQRKTDEYNKAVENGQKRVKELNGRFADWYYVISDKTYKKIHLHRDEIVKKKEAPATDPKTPGAGLPGGAGLPAGLEGLLNQPKK